jgi:hypothetical protein
MSIRSSQIFGAILFLSLMSPVAAHNIKTDADVGATFHIEPAHNPRAGEPTRAWFALTRPGGELIPLQQCNCQLTVRPQSPDIKDLSIPNPILKAVSAEQYQNIPGADLIFPKAGIYELEISGTPKGGAKFQPFKLSYPVTVLPGQISSVERSTANNNQRDRAASSVQPFRWQREIITIATGIIFVGVSLFIVRLITKAKK